jgi:hypothetical protein
MDAWVAYPRPLRAPKQTFAPWSPFGVTVKIAGILYGAAPFCCVVNFIKSRGLLTWRHVLGRGNGHKGLILKLLTDQQRGQPADISLV